MAEAVRIGGLRSSAGYRTDFVAELKKSTGNFACEPDRECRDGRTINTANIGKPDTFLSPATPAFEPQTTAAAEPVVILVDRETPPPANRHRLHHHPHDEHAPSTPPPARPAARSCSAVGYLANKTLIESWNDSKWSVVRSPDRGTSSTLNTLNAVSCIRGRSCVAVGDHASNSSLGRTLVESWNGTGWSVVRSPDRGTSSTLNAVSCLSGKLCVAVGDYGSNSNLSRTLVESWNGTVWSVMPSPSLVRKQSALNGVSCVSPTSCVAVGNYGSDTLVESWNGTAWTIVASPTPGSYGGLSGVSCSSAASCVAVGNYSNGTGSGSSILPRTLVESWNGTAWSVVPGPSPSVAYLYGVSCVSAKSCQAVGDYATRNRLRQTLVESWNGTAWSIVASPSPSTGYLYGVSCVSARACKAVGEYASNQGRGTDALIESWNGTAWSI